MSVKRINEICSKGSSNLKQKDVEGQNGTYPVYGASGLISKVDFFQQEKEYIAIVKDGSGIGRVSFLPPKSSVIGTMQYILPVKGFDIKYVCYCLQSLDLSKYKQGAAIPHIYFRDYGERLVNVTEDEKEQERIVRKLDEAFAKIDGLKQNAEKGLQAVKDLWQATLKEELNPKEGWTSKTFGEVGTLERGGNILKSDFIEDGYPCIHYGQIHTKFGAFTYKHLTCIPESLAKKKAHKGDIIIAITSEDVACSCKSTAWLGEYDIAIGAHAAIYRHTLNPKYVAYYIQAPYFQKEKEKYAHGFKVVEIKPSDIAKIGISYPSDTKQQQIVEKLDKLSEICQGYKTKYEQEVAEYDALKQSILRKAFSGEL